MKNKILYIVVPCYNEEEVLNETTKRLDEKLNTLISKKIISNKSRVMYVNDGSKDNTWNLICEISKKNKLFTGACLSRNRGHQNALLAGLMTAKKYADFVISMDADLQDDIDAIDEMIEKYYSGSEIVYGVRSARKKDTWFKKTTAESFYKFMKKMDVDIVFNHADYRLTSKKVLDNLESYKETNLFLRGIFPTIGYKNDIVYYERNERFAGESKYPLKKMLNFAWDGITSFSTKPLRIITKLSILNIFLSVLSLITTIILNIFIVDIPLIYILLCALWIIISATFLSIAIIGEYVGKIYTEVKQRPRYIISEIVGDINDK